MLCVYQPLFPLILSIWKLASSCSGSTERSVYGASSFPSDNITHSTMHPQNHVSCPTEFKKIKNIIFTRGFTLPVLFCLDVPSVNISDSSGEHLLGVQIS